MKNRIYLIIGSIFFLLVFNLYDGHAGFQDILNDAKKIFGSDEGLTESEIIEGLKEALEIGSAQAVQAVSSVDGYYKNPDIRIPLPEDVQKAEKYMRMAGFGDKVDESTKKDINRAIENLKKAMEGEDTEEIKRLADELTQASHKLAETMYAKAAEQQAQAGAGGSESTAEASKDEDVVDADFEEVNK